MKNIPRIFIGKNIVPGAQILLERDVMHYLTRVMRTDSCLVFGDGNEYKAQLSDDKKYLFRSIKQYYFNVCANKKNR